MSQQPNGAAPATPFLCLPISASTIERFISDDPTAIAESLSTPELAALLILMKAAQPGDTTLGGMEKVLASAIAVANESMGVGANPLRGVLVRDFDAGLLEGVLSRLDALSLVLMDEGEVRARKYLDVQGNWDYQYRFRRAAADPIILDPIAAYPKPVTLTDAQVRVTECLLLNDDEPLHVQGYAGTGKTHLLASLLRLLSPPKLPLVLCQTQQQLRAIKERMTHTHASLMTFQMLALDVLDHPDSFESCDLAYCRPSFQRMSSDNQVSDTHLARHLGIMPVGTLSALRVMSLCRRMVMSFCHGPASRITAVTIPGGHRFSMVEQGVMVEYANTLWRETLLPTCGLEIPIRAYHLIKLMALTGCGIPDSYTHVIVDESHDLSVPMIQVLERSNQAFITLGDDLQSLSGYVTRHSASVRSRSIGQAVRAGEAMESVLTPLIEAHPLSPTEPYKGNRSIGTAIRHYDKLQLPTNPTTILVKDLWGLLEWFLRLSSDGSGCGFELLGNRHQFTRFALDLINLFNEGRRPLHGLLFRYTTWDRLYEAETAAGNKTMERIARRLERGLPRDDLIRMLSNNGTDASTGYRLGLTSEVRSREFESVMLTPDLLPEPKSMTELERGKLLTAIYTGASRAKHEIIVPGYLVDWLADLTRQPDK